MLIIVLGSLQEYTSFLIILFYADPVLYCRRKHLKLCEFLASYSAYHIANKNERQLSCIELLKLAEINIAYWGYVGVGS